MNKILSTSKDVLAKILKGETNFKEASKKVIADKINKKDASDINALIGCELRHHLLFMHLIKDVTFNDDKELILIALANHFFLKKIEKSEYLPFIKEKNDPKLNELFAYEGSALELIQKDFKPDSIELASLRFNVPTYLLKMWFKHFGKTLTYKTLKSNVKSSDAYYALNVMKLSKDKFEANYSNEFIKEEVEGIYLAKDKKSVHNLPCYTNREIYSIRLALKDILNKVDYSSVEEMTIYSGLDDTSIRDLFVRSNKQIGLHIAVPNIESRPEILRLVRVEQAKNINYFEINDYSNLAAHISNKQDLVVVFPASSSFDKIAKYPDYLIQFKQDSFDTLIQNQKESLKGMSSLLAPGGKLLYIVDTLNRKESLSVIHEFLNSAPDFELVESNQIFPFSKLKGSFYFALMAKKDD